MSDETRLFLHRKTDFSKPAKNLLFTMNDPGAYTDIKPLLKKLVTDKRCKTLTLVVSGVAYNSFMAENISSSFEPVSIGLNNSVILKIMALSIENPIDATILTTSGRNGPETLFLFGAKSNLKSKKLFYVFCGWSDLGGAFSGNQIQMDILDGIFCVDALAKAILLKKLPDFPQEKVYATGTGQTETLELDKANEYSKRTRAELGMGANDVVVLYMSSISSELAHFYNVDNRIEETTFVLSLQAIAELAIQKSPGKNLVVLFRPHPRDTNKAEFYLLADRQLPATIKFIDGSVLGMNQAAYTADILAGTCSTEIFKAPLRNRKGVFLAFKEKGLGLDLLNSVYDKEILDAIENMDGIKMAKTAEEFAEYAINFQKAGIPKISKDSRINLTDNSTDKILDIIMA